jgi:hypothetical protein
MSDTIPNPTTDSTPSGVLKNPPPIEEEASLQQKVVQQRKPLLGVAVAAAVGVAAVIGVRAIKRRRARRQLDLLYAASAARGGLANLSAWATPSLLKRADFWGALLVELGLIASRARKGRTDILAHLR